MQKIEEFWYCVSPQENLPLYSESAIETTEDIMGIVEFIDSFDEQKILDLSSFKIFLSESLLQSPKIIKHIRTLVGVSDKRFYLDLTYITCYYSEESGIPIVTESRKNLIKHSTNFFINLLKNSQYKIELSELIADYFIEKGLFEIIKTFASLEIEQVTSIFKNLISPKELQQMQAKYRGHGAEQAFAKIFNNCGVKITPETKHTNPMAERDPNVDLNTMNIVERDPRNANSHSFDLVAYDSTDNIRILVQSLIHSSDPGQYGVNKSDETQAIKQLISNFNNSQSTSNSQVYLMGSVDGVGFSENPNGTIIKMINEFDCFFQMNTLFKIPIFLQETGIIDNVESIWLDRNYFNQEFTEYFESTYLTGTSINLVSDPIENHQSQNHP